MVHDLIQDPLLSWRDGEYRRHRSTLPGMLAALSCGDLSDFSRVRPHQFHPWAMFLTQLAAIALRRASLTALPSTEPEWRRLLLDLTDGRHEAWALVVEDLSRPAFFQPPVPEGTLARWSECEHPDDIDILVTAKNHDVKTGLIQRTNVEAWIYALATLQTSQGYPGRGYTPIARMNGGYGNRPRLGVAPGESLTARFRRDVSVLLSTWDELVAAKGFRDGGVALVWTEPWDGQTSLALRDLAPHFIEVCTRARMVARPSLSCRYTTAAVRRSAPEIRTGDVGDPWIPVERARATALTVGENGFDYRLLSRLLFDGDFVTPAQNLLPSDPDPICFKAAALTRGQGKTDGLHERTVVVAGPARWKLGQPDSRSSIGRRAAERVERAALMRTKVLYPALRQIALGETVVAGNFDQRVDEIFFDHLFATVESDDNAARLSFDRELTVIGRSELERAIERCSLPDARRLKAVSGAERMFAGCLKKHFADTLTADIVDRGVA